ncbi:MAG TPA: PilN domain-containing protein, partial [Thermoanaerobaculia bacterium]|nr:PilN domain-containing protein [Thermoanaerobaculia bacterium]
FGNSRPVVRIALLLWLLGLGLLLANVLVFRSYLSDSADKRAQIARGEEELLRQQKDVADLQTRLNGYDLVRLNDQIDFLNTQIDARTFSWSQLLDRITEVLPNDVRLSRLVPQTGSKARKEVPRASKRKLREGEVVLSISGVTRSDEALLQFVDNLFAHPAFGDPNLAQEQRTDDGSNQVKFELTVSYVPTATRRSVVVEGAPTGAAPKAVPKKTTAPAGKGSAVPTPGGQP